MASTVFSVPQTQSSLFILLFPINHSFLFSTWPRLRKLPPNWLQLVGIFLLFFNMNTPTSNTIDCVVNYAAVLALEVRQPKSGEPVVRFQFSNGTGINDYKAYPILGSASDVLLSDFISYLQVGCTGSRTLFFNTILSLLGLNQSTNGVPYAPTHKTGVVVLLTLQSQKAIQQSALLVQVSSVRVWRWLWRWRCLPYCFSWAVWPSLENLKVSAQPSRLLWVSHPHQ